MEATYIMDNGFLMTRRGFLRTAGLTVAMSSVGGAVSFLEQHKQFLRPPGALAEQDFLARCLRCQKCLAVCPTGVILPLSLSESVRGLGTPALNYKNGFCNLCLKCIEVCPTGALKSLRPEQVSIGVARIDKANCVAWNWMGCTVCVAQCPLNAIFLDDSKKPVVDGEKCNGCGICEMSCPSTSLRAYDKQSQGKGIIVIPKKVGDSR